MEQTSFGDSIAAAGPAIARGVGAVLAIPPSPIFAAPAIAAAIDRARGPEPGVTLIVTAEPLLPAWSGLPSSGGSLAQLAIAPRLARATRLVGQTGTAVVVPLSIAGALVARSALPLDQVRAVVVAWPELIDDQEQLSALIHELPKTSPRVILTSDPGGQASFIERHAFKAPVVGPLTGPVARAERVRVAATSWTDRLAALGLLIDLEDPATLVVWAASETEAAAIRAEAAARGVEATVVHGNDLPPGPAAAFDPPPPEVLSAIAARSGALLLPPGTEDYVARMAAQLRPIALPSWSDGQSADAARERDRIRARIEAGGLRGSALTVAPLLERFPTSQVAAALHALWREAGAEAAPPPPPRATPAARARVWASAGRKDGASVGDWLAFLTETVGIPRDQLGRVELRDTYTLIECDQTDAEALAERLAGQTFRARRLSARVDRGRERASSERRPPRRRSP